jgi:hypothetical protein
MVLRQLEIFRRFRRWYTAKGDRNHGTPSLTAFTPGLTVLPSFSMLLACGMLKVLSMSRREVTALYSIQLFYFIQHLCSTSRVTLQSSPWLPL